jgi:hypothetical protein
VDRLGSALDFVKVLPLHGLVRVDCLGSAPEVWSLMSNVTKDGLVRLDRLGSALDLRWAPLWICERIYVISASKITPEFADPHHIP